MTALVFGMLRSRWGRAVTIALLTALATVAAVAAPVYVARTDRHIVDSEVSRAALNERNILVTGTVEAGSTGAVPDTFERLASGWVDAPGYTSVFASQFAAQPADLRAATAEQLRRVGFRDGLCEHVVVVAGRCLMGVGDAVLGESAAQRLGLRPGDSVALAGSGYDSTSNTYFPVGAPATVTVVGVVRPRDGGEPYWGRGGTFGDTALSVDRRTMATFSRPAELQSFEAYPRPGAITVDQLPALRDWLSSSQRRSSATARLSTDLDELLDRIDERRAAVRATVPFAVAPVLVLAWAVIVLAVAAAARARRFEHGIIALRGVARPGRWWLATGETLVPMLVGALLGFTAAGGWRTPGAVPYAAVAVLGAVLAGVAAAIRTISAPPAALLRRVDVRGGRWGPRIAVFAAVAAAAATVQVRGSGGGVAGLAPALVLLAAALLAAVAAPRLALHSGRFALRRGRLTGGLAGLWLARRPSAARLLAVLVVALASLTFAAAATATAAVRQQRQAEADTGAPLVLSVGAASRQQLIAAVHAADPGGRYAMAVVPVPGGLAVDSRALAATALWPAGAVPAGLADRLHPRPAADPVTVTGATLTLDITVTRLDRTDDSLAVTLAPLAGAPAATAELGRLVAGRHTYSAAIPCTTGCRLVQIAVRVAPYAGPSLELTIHNPPTTALQPPPGGTVTAHGTEVAAVLPPGTETGAGVLRPDDGPAVLPVVATGPLGPDGLFNGFDRQRGVPATVVATVPRLPRLGSAGALVDLAYADRLAVDSSAEGAEVWLSASAPPSVLDTLTDHGLTIDARRTVADTRAALAGSGTALGLGFYLVAAVLAVVLAGAALLSGTVEASTADLRALRRQGLSARRAVAVEPLAVVLLVVSAAVVAVPAAAAAWAAAAPPELRGLPPLGPPTLALTAALAVLVLIAVLTTLRRRPST